MKIKIFLGIVFFTLILSFVAVYFLTTPIDSRSSEKVVFVPPRDTSRIGIAYSIYKQGLVKNEFLLAVMMFHGGPVASGGYYLSKDMSTWQIAAKFNSPPDLIWITIPEGLRKEEIGEILAKKLGWNDDLLQKWDENYTAMKFDYVEGVYFPDTYLIPRDEDGLAIAQRMINHFNDKFGPYFDKFQKANIQWTTALKLASIVQREAAGKNDMPLIAGILWNRLLKEQPLQVDATIQYIKGETNGKWWPTLEPKDFEIQSQYNTYLHKGLPAHPISNPGLDAIDAVLNPSHTDCLFYLHDHQRQIHCAKTYDEHLQNIKKYLQ